MINILIVSPTGGYAGIDVCIESLVYKMNRNIFNPIVVFPEGAKLKKDFEDKGIKCYSLPLNWWFPISYTGNDIIHSLNGMSPKVDALSQIIKDNNVEIVISNTSINFDAAIASNICGVKHVFFMHAGYVDNIYVDMLQSTKEQLYTLMGQLSNKVICCSKMLDDMMKHYVNNSICIYTGVDTDKFIYKERSLSEQDILNMVCIGHYNSNKQQDFVIKALNEVQKQRPELLENIHYTMIGPGEPAYIKKLKHMTKEFKLGK